MAVSLTLSLRVCVLIKHFALAQGSFRGCCVWTQCLCVFGHDRWLKSRAWRSQRITTRSVSQAGTWAVSCGSGCWMNTPFRAGLWCSFWVIRSWSLLELCIRSHCTPSFSAVAQTTENHDICILGHMFCYWLFRTKPPLDWVDFVSVLLKIDQTLKQDFVRISLNYFKQNKTKQKNLLMLFTLL